MRPKLILYTIILSLCALNLSGRNTAQDDRYVRLIKASTAETYTTPNGVVRRITGPAQFLHNNTLLICDTAIWDVNKNVVDAIGNVKLIQNKTVLSGNRIHYIADSSLAKVRGHIVELTDKDSNCLRTFNLNYNTKDSIAHFFKGGSMLDKDSNVIESLYGFYEAKIERFRFLERVEMKSDSLILIADSLTYYASEERIEFPGNVTIWQDESFLSAGGGWYDRANERYYFEKNAYILSENNEIWADKIFYDRLIEQADLHHNVQILDTVQSVIIMSDYAQYNGDPISALLYNNPSVALYSVEDGVADTLFFAADTIRYKALPMYLIDSSTVESSNKRYEQSRKDPIKEMYHKKDDKSKEGQTDNSQSNNNQSNENRSLGRLPGKLPYSFVDTLKSTLPDSTSYQMPDSTGKVAGFDKSLQDSLSVKDTLSIRPAPFSRTFAESESLLPLPDSTFTAIDSTITPVDSTITPIDSTLIRFLYANKHVRFYRSNIQGRSDSLMFNTIDSIIRLYNRPVLWQEQNQFTADSIHIIIDNKKLKRVEFSSNAFVISREDSLHYNQIKGTDMIAYFTEGELTRFDALGGVNLLFFFAEDSILTTMNTEESRAMTADIFERSVREVRYYGSTNSDFYPIFTLEREKKILRGFNNRNDERPADRYQICTRTINLSRREEVLESELPSFTFTSQLFNFRPIIPQRILISREKPQPVIAEGSDEITPAELPDIER